MLKASSAPGIEEREEEVIFQSAEASAPSVFSQEDKFAELQDKYLRLCAEFDNFRKRSRKNLEETRASVREMLIIDILAVTDNFDLAMSSETKEVPEVFLHGMKLIARQFETVLTGWGAKKIEAKAGDEFKYDLHEAMESVSSNEVPKDCIIRVLKPGYKLNDRILRPVSVSVSMGEEKKGEDTDGDEKGNKET